MDKTDLGIILVFVGFMALSIAAFVIIYVHMEVPTKHLGYGGSPGHMSPSEVESTKKH